MENKIIQEIYGQDQQLGRDFSPIRTSINQFYGIEVNDFAVTVAMTALWIAEAQMKRETESIVGYDIDFFPLETNADIIEANALRLDWASICPPSKLNYIMGNPPFIGARLMNKEQKEDLIEVFGPKWKNIGILESSVHMAWMRAVCGRLKSDYRYSKDIVYNNFPWPSCTPEYSKTSGTPSLEESFSNRISAKNGESESGKGKTNGTTLNMIQRIERTAQAILDARALYPDASLADLYDPLTMPPELRKAHKDNDSAVLSAYGFPVSASESEIVSLLFSL